DEVADPTVDASLEPALGDQLRRGILVAAGKLDVRCPLGAAGEQVELDPADPAADGEDGCAVHVAGQANEIARRASQSALPVALRVPACVLPAEEPPVVRRIAAPRDAATLAQYVLAVVRDDVARPDRLHPVD